MPREPAPFVPARRTTVVFLAVASAGLAACTTTRPGDQASAASKRREIDASVDAALSKLYETSPDARTLVQRAAGVLVFPSVIRVGFGIGGEHGNGALRVGNRTVGYYSTSAGSIGLQAGAQSKAVIYLFMTPAALERFRSSSGWTAGADATVAVADVGATGTIDTATAQQPVIAFVLTNAGLMAGVSVQGSKITPLEDL